MFVLVLILNIFFAGIGGFFKTSFIIPFHFDQNLLKETNEGYSLLIDDENQLDGLPEDFRDQAANLAEENGHNGKWMFKPTRVSMPKIS